MNTERNQDNNSKGTGYQGSDRKHDNDFPVPDTSYCSTYWPPVAELQPAIDNSEHSINCGAV